MVDEYLSEREQADQLRRWLRENWIWLVAGVVLTLAAYYGYRWWEAREAARSVAAGERFSAMLEAIAAGRRDDGLKIAGEVTGEYADTPYADQATLVLARLDVDAGDLPAAETKLARVADGSKDPELRTVARLRLARVLELKGDVLLAKGDLAGALDHWRRADAAAAAEAGAGSQVDAELLRLKIDELSARTGAK